MKYTQSIRTVFIPRIVLTACLAVLLAGSGWGQTVETYIGQLVKPGTGNDSKARLEIRRVTNLSFRPTAESERQTQETTLLAGLAKMTDWQVKAYLMDEIRWGGKLPSVEPLAAYLGDANLCEPATMALMAIGVTEGADKIIPTIRTALASATGKCLVTMLRAAGSLRDGDAAVVDALIKNATSADRGTRFIALRGLANIGDVKGTTVLAEALKTTNSFDRYEYIDLNLLFAVRLAERGLKTEASDVAKAVKDLGTSAGLPNVVLHADSAAESIKTTVAVRPMHKKVEDIRVGIKNSAGKIWVTAPEAGSYVLEVADLRGKLVRKLQGNGPGVSEFTVGSLPAGMYRMTWEGVAGKVSQSMVLY